MKYDLSAGYQRVGDMHREQGNLSLAHNAYKQSLSAAEFAMTQDKSSAMAKRQFSLCLDRVGDMHKDQGDFDASLKIYEQALTIAEKLMNSDPSNLVFVIDVGLGLLKIIDVETERSERKTKAQQIKALLEPVKEAGLEHSRLDWLLEQADAILVTD